MAAVLGLVAGCGRGQGRADDAQRVRAEFVTGGIIISVPGRAAGGVAAVESVDGEILALQQRPGTGGAALFLPFSWYPEREYRLVVRTRRGGHRSRVVRAPSPAETPPVELYLPARNPASERRRLAVPAGSRVDGQIRLSLCGSEPAVVNLALERDPELGWELDAEDPQAYADAEAFRWIVRLTPADPVHVIPLAVMLPAEDSGDRTHFLRLTYSYRTGSGLAYEGENDVVLIPADPETWGSRLTIQSVFPCDASGDADPRRARDTIALPPAWLAWTANRLGLQIATASYWDPVAFQRVTVSSDADVHLPVVVRTSVLTADGKNQAEAFQRLGTGATPLAGVDRVVLEIPPRGNASAALPVFATPDVAPGSYVREIRVTSAGTDVEVARAHFPLAVSRARSWEQAGALASLLLALGFLASAPWTARSVFRRLGTRDLVTIALFAGLTVAVVHLPLLVGGAVFVGLLGPFSFLVNSLLGQGLSSALLTALLCLVPARGTIALAIIVRYGLGAVLFGAVSPLDVLFAGSSIPLMEGAARVAGIGPRGDRTGQPTGWFAFWLALASALTGALHLLVSASVFRLFFASWYYVLFALTCGLYAGLGAWLGLALGKGLRRVQE